MEMTTITALAKEQHVSYQSIWKMVTKYEKELAGHVVVKNRVRYLDADAVAFILEKRRDHPMVAMNDDQAAIIESQQQEIERLKNKVEALLGELNQNERKISALIAEKQEMLEAKIQNKFLLEDNSRLKEGYDQLQEKSDKLREDLEEARVKAASAETKVEELEKGAQRQADVIKFTMKELESFRPSLFGFYRKKKTKGDDNSLINPE